jgi:hypothetical protein
VAGSIRPFVAGFDSTGDKLSDAYQRAAKVTIRPETWVVAQFEISLDPARRQALSAGNKLYLIRLDAIMSTPPFAQ